MHNIFSGIYLNARDKLGSKTFRNSLAIDVNLEKFHAITEQNACMITLESIYIDSKLAPPQANNLS